MRKIILASHNPVKARAVLEGFQKMFPGESFELALVEAASEVSIQPLSDVETLRGAFNRARNALTAAGGPAQRTLQGDFWVGVEGGVEDLAGEMAAFAWVVIGGRSQKNTIQYGKARTAMFFLPPPVAGLVRQGKELGEADDIVFKRSNSKQENGAVGLLTGDIIDRAQLYEMAVVLALVPFKNQDVY